MKIRIKEISVYTIDTEKWIENVKPYEPEVTEKDCIEYCKNHTEDAIEYYADRISITHKITTICKKG